jgi:hypothetical protein
VSSWKTLIYQLGICNPYEPVLPQNHSEVLVSEIVVLGPVIPGVKCVKEVRRSLPLAVDQGGMPLEEKQGLAE